MNSTKNSELQNVKIQNVKRIMVNEGFKSDRQFGLKIGEKPGNLSKYLNGKTDIQHALANKIINAFPDKGYRRAFILGEDEFMTEADYAKVSWDRIFYSFKDNQNASSIMLNALFALAKLSGFEIDQNIPCTQDESIEHFLRNLHAGVTISRDGEQVSLSLAELDALECKLRDWVEFELLHMMK